MNLWRLTLVLFGGAIAAADWQTGIVAFSRYQLRMDGNAANASSGMVQTGHERFELHAPDGTVYDVEEWVAPKKLMRLRDGTRLEFAVDGRNLLVRAPDGKTRKLKIVAKHEPGK